MAESKNHLFETGSNNEKLKLKFREEIIYENRTHCHVCK